MHQQRPDPDAVLASLRKGDRQGTRGLLRIFFGYAAGVGKTYAMLQAAHRAKGDGRDVVVGYVEPHARPATAALLDGLELLPTVRVPYRGVTLHEVDVPAALERRPAVLLVDELAHTNAPGSLHEKRWQDIDDLLAAGIDVWTTLNVQHIESLNDVIGQITGIVVRETIPDGVFYLADEIELIDVTPDELLDRIAAGRVYLPAQARQALARFFQPANLTALRELSLRQAARRVRLDVESSRSGQRNSPPRELSGRLLVCVGPSPTASRVLRVASQLATALDIEWIAVSVDAPGTPFDASARTRITEHLRLAERLGAESAILAGPNIAAAISEFAVSRGVAKIVLGRTGAPWWRRIVHGTVVDALLAASKGVDVYVVQGAVENTLPPPAAGRQAGGLKVAWKALVPAVGPVMIAAAIAAIIRQFEHTDAEANTVMLFLAAIAWVAARHGRPGAIAASALAVLTFDFFFVKPQLTLSYSDLDYTAVFALMFGIGLTIGTLASRLRGQIETSRRQEQRTAFLYDVTRRLSRAAGTAALADAACNTLTDRYQGGAVVYLDARPQPPTLVGGPADVVITSDPVSLTAADWVILRHQIAGAGTDTLPNALALFVPLAASGRTLGALAVRAADMRRLDDPEERRLITACGAQLALALDREPEPCSEHGQASAATTDRR